MIFTIYKGKHYSNRWLFKLLTFFSFRKYYMNVNVCFEQMPARVPGWKGDFINKLFGISLGLKHHHKESARFGWSVPDIVNTNRIFIHAYIYKAGKRFTVYLCQIEPKKEYKMLIVYSEEYEAIFFEVKDSSGKTIVVEKFPYAGLKKKSLFSYKLWPYYGGQEVAPADIKIRLKHEKL